MGASVACVGTYTDALLQKRRISSHGHVAPLWRQEKGEVEGPKGQSSNSLSPHSSHDTVFPQVDAKIRRQDFEDTRNTRGSRSQSSAEELSQTPSRPRCRTSPCPGHPRLAHAVTRQSRQHDSYSPTSISSSRHHTRTPPHTHAITHPHTRSLPLSSRSAHVLDAAYIAPRISWAPHTHTLPRLPGLMPSAKHPKSHAGRRIASRRAITPTPGDEASAPQHSQPPAASRQTAAAAPRPCPPPW